MTIKPLTKLIIVDDDKDILLISQLALEDLEGVEVKACSSAEEGIKTALSFAPDLLVIDVMMPNMDGIAMVQAMKLIPSLAHIPVIFLTAKIQKAELEQYHSIGIQDVITKPFDPLNLPTQIFDIWNKINQSS